MEKEMKFNVGDRVKCISNIFGYTGVIGTVISILKNRINNEYFYCVECDKLPYLGHNGGNTVFSEVIKGLKNGKDGHCLFFNKDELSLFEPNNKDVVQVVFKNNNLPYSFLNDIEDLEVGDKVVVDTKYGYELATVKSFNTDKNATKMVVCKVNIKEFEKKRDDLIKKAEEEKLKKQKKDELLKKMKDLYASRSQIDEYKKMAKSSKEMADLLKEYEDVENGNWNPEELDLPF